MTGGGYLNGSGYPDPTAYKAIKETEEKEMEARSGELWRYAAGEVEREGVVVGTDGVVVTILPLLDICFDGAIEITTSAGVKYVQPLRLSYTTQKKLVAYLRDVPDDTMREIKTAISAGLGLTSAEPSRPDATPDDGARDEVERFKAENQRLKSELIESTVRAKVMTEQYNTLLERFCDSLR
nr:MAG TPA: mRNA interferase EndoA [Caudoviricetes sp.]